MCSCVFFERLQRGIHAHGKVTFPQQQQQNRRTEVRAFPCSCFSLLLFKNIKHTLQRRQNTPDLVCSQATHSMRAYGGLAARSPTAQADSHHPAFVNVAARRFPLLLVVHRTFAPSPILGSLFSFLFSFLFLLCGQWTAARILYHTIVT